MDKMLETYVQRDYAERDFDKDQALEKVLESTIMSIAKLLIKLKTNIFQMIDKSNNSMYNEKAWWDWRSW